MHEETLRHDREMKTLDREHGRLQRRDESHDNARDTFVPVAARVVEWLDYESGTKHGPAEADWYPELSPQPEFGTIEEVAAGLWAIAATHPTKAVRATADALRSDIAGHYGDIALDTSTGGHTTRVEPSFDQLLQWLTRAKELLEMVHDPPADPDPNPGVVDSGAPGAE